MNEWVIVGPLGPELDSTLERFPVIAVDGGADFSKKIDLWVGDADSIQGSLPDVPRIELATNKDRSDLAHALLQVPDSVVKLHLWGFLGKRRDHEWFNLGEVVRWLTSRAQVSAYFYDHRGKVKVVSLTRGELTVTGLFSLASLEINEVSLTGECDYLLQEPTEVGPLSSVGLSNRARGLIQVNAIRPILLFFEEE